MKKFHAPNSIRNSKRSKVSPPSAPPTRDQSRKNGDVTWNAQTETKTYSVSDQSNVKTRVEYLNGSQAKLRMPTPYAITKTNVTDSRHSTMSPTNSLHGPSHDQTQDKSNTTLLATTGLTRTTEKCSRWLHSQLELLHALATTTNPVTFDANGAKSRSRLSDASEPTDQKVNMTISTMKICTNMITRWLIHMWFILWLIHPFYQVSYYTTWQWLLCLHWYWFKNGPIYLFCTFKLALNLSWLLIGWPILEWLDSDWPEHDFISIPVFHWPLWGSKLNENLLE
jgi:hypothetical protein